MSIKSVKSNYRDLQRGSLVRKPNTACSPAVFDRLKSRGVAQLVLGAGQWEPLLTSACGKNTTSARAMKNESANPKRRRMNLVCDLVCGQKTWPANSVLVPRNLVSEVNLIRLFSMPALCHALILSFPYIFKCSFLQSLCRFSDKTPPLILHHKVHEFRFYFFHEIARCFLSPE